MLCVRLYSCICCISHDAGLIGQLEMSTFSLLAKLQEKMAAAVKSVGNIEHEVYPLLLGIGTLLYRIHVTHIYQPYQA